VGIWGDILQQGRNIRLWVILIALGVYLLCRYCSAPAP
jgi:hypothetical protein